MELATVATARERIKLAPSEEIFVRVEYNPKFAVSNFGTVKNTWNNKIKKTHVKKTTGDVVVSMDGIIYRVSHLVAIAFIENPNNSRFVLHKDNDKQNNRESNLYWSSSAWGKTIKHKKR